MQRLVLTPHMHTHCKAYVGVRAVHIYSYFEKGCEKKNVCIMILKQMADHKYHDKCENCHTFYLEKLISCYCFLNNKFKNCLTTLRKTFSKKKCNVTFGRGDTPGNSSWWVLCLVLQILTRFQTKNVIFRLDLQNPYPF